MFKNKNARQSFALLIGVLLISSIAILLQDSVQKQTEATSVSSSSGKPSFDKKKYPVPGPDSDVKISVQIGDQDFNTSPRGSDSISFDTEDGVGPVKISVSRHGDSVVLGYAGGDSSNSGKIDSPPLAQNAQEKKLIRQFGPIYETSPESGVFEFSFSVKSTDGPVGKECPLGESFESLGSSDSNGAEARFDDSSGNARHCVLVGDVMTVEYTDPNDSSGNSRTVTASATFGLSTAQVKTKADTSSSGDAGKDSADKPQSKAVSKNTDFPYRIGRQIVLIIADADLNLDSKQAESHSLDLILFQVDGFKIRLGEKEARDAFDPRPSVLRETGENTGIFFTKLEIPRKIKSQTIFPGDKISFEYVDFGGAGSLFVGDQSQDIEHVIKTSNVGATIKFGKAGADQGLQNAEKSLRQDFVKQNTAGGMLEQAEQRLPPRLKASAKWWHDGVISDKQFADTIAYLLDRKLIELKATGDKASSGELEHDKGSVEQPTNIPQWFKKNSFWWYENKISQKEYILSIKYLLEKKVIT